MPTISTIRQIFAEARQVPAGEDAKTRGFVALTRAVSTALADDHQFSSEERAAIADEWRRFVGDFGANAASQQYYQALEAQGFPPLETVAGLHPDLLPSGDNVRSAGVPAALGPDAPVDDWFRALGRMSSVHLGGGLVLTARHVLEVLRGQRLGDTAGDGAFAGRDPFSTGGRTLALRVLPEAGSYDVGAFTAVPKDSFGTYHDWALLQIEDWAGRSGLGRLRATRDVKRGETLWVVGDAHNDGSLEVAAGKYLGAYQANAFIAGMESLPGQSGGPVLDGEGNVVGIVYAGGRLNGEAGAMIITTESIVEAVRDAREQDATLPLLELHRPAAARTPHVHGPGLVREPQD
ncbi:MAG: trypsin-like peptidase domain-containing protein [Deltaproteobacteria bacterium]|nr:trypsin-like peptidase domain-containing protein [Deltaproteobacteria bacterium]